MLQIFSSLIVCSYATFGEKVRALFDLFDFNNDKVITKDEMTILIKSTLNGICRLTGVNIPASNTLTQIATLAFKTADSQHQKDNQVNPQEFMAWCSSTRHVVNILTRYNTSDGELVKKNIPLASADEQNSLTKTKPPLPSPSPASSSSSSSSSSSASTSSPNNPNRRKSLDGQLQNLSPPVFPILNFIDEIRQLYDIFSIVDNNNNKKGHVTINEFSSFLKTSNLWKDSKGEDKKVPVFRTLDDHKHTSAITLKFKDVLRTFYMDATKSDIERMISLSVYTPVPESIVKKISSIFLDCDREFNGTVKFDSMLAILSPSPKLNAFTPVPNLPRPRTLVGEGAEATITLHDLLAFLFDKTHKNQMEQVTLYIFHTSSSHCICFPHIASHFLLALSFNSFLLLF